MGGELRPTPCFSQRRAKQKSVIKKGGALRLVVWEGGNRTEFPLNSPLLAISDAGKTKSVGAGAEGSIRQ